MKRHTTPLTVLALALAAGLSGAAVAQTPAPAPAKPAEPDKAADKDKKPVAPPSPPSLDELLGITPKKPGEAPRPGEPAAGETPGDQSKTDLNRLLTGEEMGEAFKQAIALMGDAAKRLDSAKDAGLTTQRVQEDAIRKLDQLLASLEKQQQQSQSQSQSQSQDSKSQPSSRKSQPQQGQPQPGDNKGEWDGPTKREGPLNAGLGSARAAWGAALPRIREMLLQGSADRFSAKYQALTEAYYRKLAEEGKAP